MKLRVLVFDDDPAVCAILRLLLERYGCEVMTYANPSLCPQVVAGQCRCTSDESCTDLIISDLEMPEMNGLELVSRLGENGCKVPHVLLISGMWSSREIGIARQMNCHVIHKPFTVGTLYRWVDECARALDPNRPLRPVGPNPERRKVRGVGKCVEATGKAGDRPIPFRGSPTRAEPR